LNSQWLKIEKAEREKKAPTAYKELSRKSKTLCKVPHLSLQSSLKQKTTYSNAEA